MHEELRKYIRELERIEKTAMKKKESNGDVWEGGRKSKGNRKNEKRKVNKGFLYKTMITFDSMYKEKFKRPYRKVYTRIDWNKMKNFILKYGEDNTIDILKYVFENWERLKLEWRVDSLTLGVLLVFSERIIPFVGRKDKDGDESDEEDNEKMRSDIGWREDS